MADKIKPGNIKTYKGNLSLDWYGKDYSIIQAEENENADGLVHPPKLNWVNGENSAFYLPNDDKKPVWIKRGDIRVHEARHLEHQNTYTAAPKAKAGSLGLEGDQDWNVEESAATPETPLAGNILIKGEKLLALNSLKKEFAGQVKCVFIDPPCNTGSAFTHYDDGLEHSVWLSLMRDRLVILRELLTEDGSLWITIDDNECHYLKVLCNEVFRRENCICNVR